MYVCIRSISMTYVYTIGSICMQYAWLTKQSYKEKRLKNMKKRYALAMKAILTHLPTEQSLPKTCRLTITYSADTPAYRATTAENMAVADDYADTPAY